VRQHAVADLSELPTWGFGHRSPVWWGTLGFVAIETMGFALAIATYLYLVHINQSWPLGNTLPDHWPGTAMTLVLLASLVPNWMADRNAHRQDLKAVRRDLVIMTLIGLVTIAIRFYEFHRLAVNWDQNAYGSVTWVILGLHATHLITDVGDTVVLAALMFTRHGRGKRYSDVSDNAFYWYFVVVAWLPLYAIVYWLPRWGP
jgi:heme/copper-type cytochrome/quinol oxidase subunit 3